jgi:RNA polymerase sigma-70 factor (ECF subfamily)
MIATAEGAGTPSDRDVIASSLERPECFEAVFERHATAIYRHLRRRVGAALAEELTAETFARAFRARRRFDRRGEPALPWLYGIAANLVRMHRRAEERRLRAYARAADPGLEPSPSGDSDRRLDAAALRPALAEALAGLPHAQREVLLLHAWAELSHEEIAVALSISAGTVRSRLHRARTYVAERIAPSGNKAGDVPMVRTP